MKACLNLKFRDSEKYIKIMLDCSEEFADDFNKLLSEGVEIDVLDVEKMEQ